MEYVPYHRLEGVPSIIVDGFGTEGTVLTLSHWPGAGTPPELADDLSTQIAFRYLDRPDLAVAAEAVSNNHFDEDGVCGIYAVINPEDAQRRRDALIDVASAGDFGTFKNRDSARIALTLMAYADEDRSPLAPETFAQPYPDQTAVLYRETIGLLPEMLDSPEKFESLWAGEDGRLGRDLERIHSGAIKITERSDIDLAIVTVPPSEDLVSDNEWSGGAHPMAINNSTERMRILIQSGNRFAVRYRYETWVMYQSRSLLPRADLAPLAVRLSELEANGEWSFDDVDDLTPSLHLTEGGASSISPDRFVDLVEEFLAGL